MNSMDIEGLSLGHTFLESHGLSGVPVVTLNYVNPDHRLVLPYPDGDWYLRNTAVPAVKSGETVICNTLIKGLMSYYERMSLVDDSRAQIMQVDPRPNGVVYGYPATDPLARLDASFFRGNSSYLASTFYGEQVLDQVRRLDLEPLQRPDSILTNNKAQLRRFAPEFGYSMLPGVLIESRDDIYEAAESFQHLSSGVWVKFPAGSGGDLVRYCPNPTRSLIEGAIGNIRSAVLGSFDQGQFNVTGQNFWPEESLAPNNLPIIVEADARNLGDVLINGSTQFVTNQGGEIALIGHFQQMTTGEGEYLGNRPYLIKDEQIKSAIEGQVERVARYNIQQNGYFGIQGADWFLLRDAEGRFQVRVVELNSRPTANTPPVIIARKLGMNHWVNTNVYTDRLIRSFVDYADIVGKELTYGEGPGGGLVVPQAFRTLVFGDTIIPSPNFKALILGSSDVQCDEIMHKLIQKGVRFNP